MVDNALGHFAGDPGEPCDKVVDARTALKVFEECFDRHSCATKNPCTADFVSFVLYCRA